MAGRRPRVMQVITHFDMGGAERIAIALIEELRAAIDFRMFAVLDPPQRSTVGRDMAARLDGWDVPYRFGVAGRFKSGGVALAAARLAKALRAWRPDVVHLHTEIPELTYAAATLLSARARRTPVIRTVHNSVLWIAWPAIGRRVTQRLARADAIAVSRSAAAADAAIATRATRRAADVIPNGVRPPHALAPATKPGPFRILFAGRLVHQKGADLLPAILAAAAGRSGRRDVEVTIAGSGAMHEPLSRTLAAAPTGWTVRLVPPIERLAERLADFDAVLMPSRFEGFGLLALEVLMAGVPLVTTDAPGLDEAVPDTYPLRARVDDVAALAAHLVAAMAAPEEHRALAARFGHDLAARFAPAAMAQAYAQRYRRLADPGSSACV